MSYITINGKRIPTPEDFKIEYSLDETSNTVVIAASSPVDIDGKLATYVRDVFFDSCDSINNRVPIFYDPGCGQVYKFDVTYEGVRYCPEECTSQVRLQMIEDKKCYNYFKETVFWKNGWYEDVIAGNIEVPKMKYTLQPSEFLFYMRTRGSVVFGLLLSFLDGAIGGKKYRTCPLLRQVIEYHAAKCDLKFSSSILQGDYRNLVMFEPIAEKGKYWQRRTAYPGYDAESSTNWTVAQILDNLKPVFNAEWRIIDNVLYFERYDFFEDFRDMKLLDVVNQKGCIDEEVCYTYFVPSKCAYGRFSYASDSVDLEGMKALKPMYDDIVEWNDPPSQWQEGECETKLEFGPVRFTRGRVSGTGDGDDIDGDDVFEYSVDRFRAGYGVGFPTLISSTAPSVDHIPILENDIAEYPKLILLQDNYNPDDATPIRRLISTGLLGQPPMGIYDYNYPLYFDAEYSEPELYQRFHYIDNPRGDNQKRYRIDSIEFAPEDFCETVNLIHENFNRLYVNTHLGKGIIEGSVTINDESRTITVKDIIIRC